MKTNISKALMRRSKIDIFLQRVPGCMGGRQILFATSPGRWEGQKTSFWIHLWASHRKEGNKTNPLL